MNRFTFLVLILAVACSPNKQTEFDASSVELEVKEMLDSYHKAISENGLTGEFAYLDNSSEFFWVPPGYKTALSYDSVRRILEQNAKAFKHIEFRWDTLQIVPLSASIVNYTGIVSGTMVDTAGVSSPVSIIESGTIIKRATGWKLLSGQSAALTIE